MIVPEASCFSCPHGLATLLTGGGLVGILFEVDPMSDNLDLTGNDLFEAKKFDFGYCVCGTSSEPVLIHTIRSGIDHFVRLVPPCLPLVH